VVNDMGVSLGFHFLGLQPRLVHLVESIKHESLGQRPRAIEGLTYSEQEASVTSNT
jgi:hypothetical protein